METATIIAEAAPAVATLVRTIIAALAGAGVDERECESAKTQILAAVMAIDATLIASEAKEWAIAREQPK